MQYVQGSVQDMQCKNPYHALHIMECWPGGALLLQIGQDAKLRAGYSRIQGTDTQTGRIHSSAMINIAKQNTGHRQAVLVGNEGRLHGKVTLQYWYREK